MNAELRGRKRLERSHDFHIWKVLGGGGALRELKRLTYDSVVYFYFRYPLNAEVFERSRSLKGRLFKATASQLLEDTAEVSNEFCSLRFI